MAQQFSEDILKISETWFDQLPKAWKQWLEENWSRGCSPQELLQILKENGFALELPRQFKPDSQDQVDLYTALSDDQEDHVIQLLLSGLSPYKVAQQTHNDQQSTFEEHLAITEKMFNSRLFKHLQQEHHLRKKREWLISTIDQLQQLDSHRFNTIPKIATPKFEAFIQDYYSQNRPVILTGGISHWPALQKWTPDYFAQVVSDQLVEVQMGRSKVKDFERQSPALKQMIPMREYVAKVLSAGVSNDFYMTANNTQNSKSAIANLFNDIADFGKGYCRLDQQNSLSFIWFGPKGTFTPLHHDLTNNMLVQIYGRKKVTLVPALHTQYLYNDRWVFSELSSLDDIDFKRYPLATNIKPITCILEEGEALFIPIGWWHTVESLDVSISVSFTHFKADNHYAQTFPRAHNE